MNKTNGVRDQASASTSLYSKEQNCKQRPSSSGFPTFLKWFKKNEKRHKPLNGAVLSKSSQFSSDGLSPPSSPILGNLSPSSSCDSVLSTSTTGFAFIKPQYYKPYNSAEEPKILITDSPETESYRRRIKKYNNSEDRPQLSLREKYFLFDTDTLNSNTSEGGYDNIRYFERSLPNAKKNIYNGNNQSIRNRRNHRRAVSDSSKDKKSGAYVHVKGKRKAPPPPPLSINKPEAGNEDFYETIRTERNSNGNEIYSSGSTLGRKKRRAPPPPLSPKFPDYDTPKSVLAEGLFDDKEIKAIIEGTRHTSSECSPKMFSKRTSMESSGRDSNDKFRTTSNEDLTSGTSSDKCESPTSSPISPISPRPWYKRSNSSHRDSSIPFKREIILKTMEKRRGKHREKELTATNLLPEVGYSRASIFDSSHKFGFFLRHKENPDEAKVKEKDKRRSGIGIPNISELDREAAEILNKEHANEKARKDAEREKFFNLPDHLILQQQMFGSKSHISQEIESDDAMNQIVSTKDLISKFESSSNQTRITLNTSFIGRTENFFQDKTSQEDKRNENKLQTTTSDDPQKVTSKSPSEASKPTNSILGNVDSIQSIKIDETPKSTGNEQTEAIKQERNASQKTWTCPFCTLENPYWRIICEACERLKPYEKLNKFEGKPTTKLSAKIDPLPNSLNVKSVTKTENNVEAKNESKDLKSKDDNLKSTISQTTTDWEKKAEKVMKYFMPRNSSNILAKSSSETAVVKKPPVLRKSPSPSKLPISSPNFSRRSKMLSMDKSEKQSSSSNYLVKMPEKEIESDANPPIAEKRQPLLDSSLIVTTVTPVFYAQTTVIEQPQQPLQGEIETTPTDLQSKNSSIIENENKRNLIDLKEVRSARIAKFTQLPNAASCGNGNKDDRVYLSEVTTSVDDNQGSLEREKRRLREKIRAMNAKALADKYPILQKNVPPEITSKDIEKSAESTTTDDKDREPQKRGAIKKIFPKTRSLDDNVLEKKEDVMVMKEPLSPRVTKKPKKVSTSVQTSRIVKRSDESKNSSHEGLSDDFTGDLKLDNLIYNPIFESPSEYVQFSDYDRAKVKEISQKLQSPEGISDFKATLKYPCKGMSRTDTITLNKFMRSLETAIAEGEDERAAKIAMDLAKMKVSLQVTKVKNRPSSGGIDYNQSIIVDLFVEDKVSQKGPIQIPVKPLMTIIELKEKAEKDFDIPIELQKWLINDEPATDNSKTLLEYGVRDSNSGFYLYLITPENKVDEKKEVNLPIPKTSIALPEDIDESLSDTSSDSHNGLEQDESLQGAIALSPPEPVKDKIKDLSSDIWHCPLCTLINPADVLACFACSKAKPNSNKLAPPQKENYENYSMSAELRQFLEGVQTQVQYRRPEKRNDLNIMSPNRKSSEIFNIVEEKQKTNIKAVIKPRNITVEMLKSSNFSSPNITRNKYRGVDNYNPNRKNNDTTQIVSSSPPTRKEKSRAPAPPTKTEETNHYMELLKLDNSDVVANTESFECPICFMKCKEREGVVLRDCLHSFCRECLSNTVRYSEEAEVKCPFMDAEYSCESILQEREIKAVVSIEVYEKHLAKSVRVAEHQIENAFHCKTPNCRGWCIYEDNVNEFKCPVCRIVNCLMCRVVHDGLTCKQYQDRLISNCDSNTEARRTKEMLNEMVDKGEAMNCPTCQVIMMKKWGCDWLKCSMCKTEVCWVTRGPRWGPGGKGDTTGGCKCGVDGKKCHPKCNYCH